MEEAHLGSPSPTLSSLRLCGGSELTASDPAPVAAICPANQPQLTPLGQNWGKVGPVWVTWRQLPYPEQASVLSLSVHETG